MRRIFWSIESFFNRVKNLWRWLPVIWKDQDYDDHFIVEILIKKLEHTRDFFLSDKTHIAQAEKVAAEIQEAINRLHQTRDSFEFYESPAIELLEQKWGKTTFTSVPYSYDNKGNVLSYEMVSKTEKVNTEEEKEQYLKEFRKALKEARKQYLIDKINTYKYVAKKIDSWWD